MNIYVSFLIGIIIGSIVSAIYNGRHKVFGTLIMDFSNPEKDTFRLDINGDTLENVAKKKQIILKIDIETKLPQN